MSEIKLANLPAETTVLGNVVPQNDPILQEELRGRIINTVNGSKQCIFLGKSKPESSNELQLLPQQVPITSQPLSAQTSIPTNPNPNSGEPIITLQDAVDGCADIAEGAADEGCCDRRCDNDCCKYCFCLSFDGDCDCDCDCDD